MPIFRNVTEQELSDVARLEQQSFSDSWSEKSLQDTNKQPQTMIAVAEVEGQIAGYCILYYVVDEGEIARIAVDENFRRQGIGRGLLDYICEQCKEKGVERLLLDVRESNERARQFYHQYGFEIDGVRKAFYENPKEDAVLMSKRIDNLFH